ncbi:MAG: PEP-CTERM sorting domain-containing protein [Luteolibacter sp.]
MKRTALALVFIAAPMQQAAAIIVGGTLGTGNNNASEAGLQSYLSSTSQGSFSYWGNLVRVSNSSGVYLGYNATSLTGWVLSAAHIGPEPTSITVAGNSYSVSGVGTPIGTTDLILYEIGGGTGDPALPSLSTVPLATTAATAGEFLIMTGRGFTTSSAAPYPWGSPGTSDLNGTRWGTNTVEFNTTIGSNYIITDFDAPASAQTTAYEGQGAVGDSGGGIFIRRGGQWVLSGIAHFVDAGPVFDPTVGGQTVDPAEYGDYTGYTDIRSYLAAIQLETGTLIPEPSSGLLAMAAASLVLLRRRRGDFQN